MLGAAMTDIGREKTSIVVEPVELPLPLREETSAPAPDPVPAEPVIPAGAT